MSLPIPHVDVRATVLSAIQSILPGLPAASIAGSKHLKELGADSVDRVEIIMQVLERCAVSAPMSRFSDVPDIDHLVAVVTEMVEDKPS